MNKFLKILSGVVRVGGVVVGVATAAGPDLGKAFHGDPQAIANVAIAAVVAVSSMLHPEIVNQVRETKHANDAATSSDGRDVSSILGEK